MDTIALPNLMRYQDLQELGLTRHRFDRLLEAEEYERIAPGLFLRADTIDDTTAAWMAITAKKPDATLCLLTALALHDLTDEIPRSSSDIAIPRGTHPMTIRHAPIAWHRFATDTFTAGRTEYALPGALSIGLYSPERTIIDLFRLRHEWGERPRDRRAEPLAARARQQRCGTVRHGSRLSGCTACAAERPGDTAVSPTTQHGTPAGDAARVIQRELLPLLPALAQMPQRAQPKWRAWRVRVHREQDLPLGFADA